MSSKDTADVIYVGCDAFLNKYLNAEAFKVFSETILETLPRLNEHKLKLVKLVVGD
ncbi:MAG: hypothetical protein QW453_02275 [Thermoprotei archaeon]